MPSSGDPQIGLPRFKCNPKDVTIHRSHRGYLKPQSQTSNASPIRESGYPRQRCSSSIRDPSHLYLLRLMSRHTHHLHIIPSPSPYTQSGIMDLPSPSERDLTRRELLPLLNRRPCLRLKAPNRRIIPRSLQILRLPPLTPPIHIIIRLSTPPPLPIRPPGLHLLPLPHLLQHHLVIREADRIPLVVEMPE